METENHLLEIESRVREAQALVVPSDTLRGRVVSEILRRESGNELSGKIYRFCCLALILNASMLMSARSMDRWWSELYQPVSSNKLLSKAQSIQEQSRLDPTESLAEAYSQWKSQLAEHWPNALAKRERKFGD